MAKIYHCVGCGMELTMKRKAFGAKNIILNLVEAHDCERVDWDEEPIVDRTLEKKMRHVENYGTGTERLAGMKEVHAENYGEQSKKVNPVDLVFPSVEKSNRLMTIDPLPSGDLRDKKHLREPIKSTAPPSLMSMAKQVSGAAEPGRELESPHGEE